MTLPRISLVTPVFNSANYLEQTIRSVLAQNYPNLEYYVMDGGSTDGTLDIIRKYESQITGWVSEPDRGMYDAINKGFARTSGEIMGWISATDQLQIGGLSVVGSVFRDLQQVEWITGRPTIFNDAGMTVSVLPLPRWSRLRFLAGANRYIQQESTYWRRSLWEKAGGRTDSSRRSASDFELWLRFFDHAQLYSVNALIGGFRVHPDSDALTTLDNYHRICEEHLSRAVASLEGEKAVKLFRKLTHTFQPIPLLGRAWNRFAMSRLYGRPGRDWPPVIDYQSEKWTLRG